MNSETADMLRATLRRLFAETDGCDVLRRLDDLGWADLAAADPETSARLLFEAQGRALVSTAALDMVVLHALDRRDDADVAVHPYPGNVPMTAGRIVGGQARIDGVVLGALEPAATLAVPVAAGDGEIACPVLRLPVDGLDTDPIDGMAPELGLVRVRGAVDPTGVDLSPVAWPGAVAAARRALAHELAAIAAVMVELAAGYAVDRVQFGRPIGAFQAIQHRLADSHVAVEAARSAATHADETGGELAAGAAKALAGNALRTSARHCQQVLGAIGFTWDHPFHFALRRGTVLELLYGSAPELRRELGRALCAGGQPFRELVSL